ncbi:hypothetical protein [Breznakia pachnodae]|uniref:Uncharacterized protein n=1 Tax=Breznakia pachnodae TaxID=265178 RepID=A0ABU0DZE4_9FIRM|nr:hypothetical protein [Breznakia pachnodae]MDQ0360007.1 hypothetical protein [Breznakia pachnodae]
MEKVKSAVYAIKPVIMALAIALLIIFINHIAVTKIIYKYFFTYNSDDLQSIIARYFAATMINVLAAFFVALVLAAIVNLKDYISERYNEYLEESKIDDYDDVKLLNTVYEVESYFWVGEFDSIEFKRNCIIVYFNIDEHLIERKIYPTKFRISYKSDVEFEYSHGYHSLVFNEEMKETIENIIDEIITEEMKLWEIN